MNVQMMIHIVIYSVITHLLVHMHEKKKIAAKIDDRREQCCAANYEQVVNHVVPSCYS
jgi:hypothetical protein